MIPLLIVSNNDKLVNRYVNKLKEDAFFFEVTPSTKEYSIADIKDLIKTTKIFNPKKRIYFLPNFQLSSVPAQNSFLKLLEEPPTNVQFILSTDSQYNLFPTIISRVKIIKLQIKEGQNVVEKQFIVTILEDLINQTSATKIPLVEFIITDREVVKNTLIQIILFFRNRLASDKNSPLIIREIILLKNLFENNNLNSQLTIDQALIFIWKTYRMK